MTQVNFFLGMVIYNFKFINNSINIIYPLYQLFKKNNSYTWNKKCNFTFYQIKQILISAQVLIHFNHEHKIKLACDYGIRGVISHILSNKEERLIAMFLEHTIQLNKNMFILIRKH